VVPPSPPLLLAEELNNGAALPPSPSPALVA
jgi:hypothetical protein